MKNISSPKKLPKLKFEEVYNQLENDVLNPYQFYNVDLSSDQLFAVEHYIKNSYDNIEKTQKLKKVFFDIEVFLNHQIGIPISEMVMTGKHLVNSISHFYSSENTFYAYMVPPKGFHITESELEEFLFTESTKKVKIGTNGDGSDKMGTYFEDGQKVKVRLFDNGIDLVTAFWEKIKENDPAIYSGWNSDGFDTPYLYHYLLHHFGDHQQVANIMSNFGEVEIDNGRDRAGNNVHRIRIIDYNNLDLMYAYKERADGGLGLGQKLASYALNNVAKVELGLTKYEYKAEGLTLDQLYEQDPKNFLLYNLWDTVLAYKIDEKTGMTDLYNMQRRKMRTPLSSALRGSSPLFDTNIYGSLKEEGKFVRWGINSESSFGISEEELKEIPKVKSLTKIKWNITEITQRDCGKALNRFPGAYVKPPRPGIYDKGIVSDLDANRLYPSMINQYNIGIDTFFGRIIPPTMDKVFDFYRRFFGHCSVDQFPEAIYSRLMQESERFVENLKEDEFDEDEETRDNSFKNKNEAKLYYYYMMVYLLKNILKSGFTYEELINPQTVEQYAITRTYFNNLIELMEMAHPQEKEYNYWAYQWIVNQEELKQPLRIIENFNEPSYRIVTIDGKNFAEYLQDNRIGVTISGTLFKTHENKLSLFYTFLNELYSLRNQYKTKMYEYPEDSFERKEFNRRQLTTKVIMNSTYGLLGMSTFRYSNKWLAKSITTSGRLALKTAQYFTEKFIDAKFLNN